MGAFGTGLMTSGAEGLSSGLNTLFTSPQGTSRSLGVSNDPYAGTEFGLDNWEL